MSNRILDVPAKHPFSLSGVLDDLWTSFAENAMRTGWTPLTKLAETAVVSLLQKTTEGRLRISTSDHTYLFPSQPPTNDVGNSEPEFKAELHVVKDTFWVRLCAMGDLGFAEAYMYGEVECNDLISLFQFFLSNRESLDNMGSRLSFLFALPRKITSFRFLNSIGNSRSNISAHYDISNVMFSGFLSEDMTYSCAIFKDLDSDLGAGTAYSRRRDAQGLKTSESCDSEKLNCQAVGANGHAHPSLIPHQISGDQTPINTTNGNDAMKNHQYSTSAFNGHHRTGEYGPTNGHPAANTHTNGSTGSENDELYEAQMRKLDHIIKKAKIQPGHRVLEIGSGWGSMAMRIALSIPETTVDTLTLSVEQQSLAQKRIAAAGLSDRITVHLMDYRDMPSHWEGIFDRLVSVEMLEAVGEKFMETYWGVVDWALKPKTGAGTVQVITLPEARWDRYRNEIDFIQKWVRELYPSWKSTILNASFPFVLFNVQIFPGGILPTLTLVLDTLRSGSGDRLVVDSVSNIGPHYARTLREWCQRFLDRFDDVIVPALKTEYPSVMGDECGEQGRQEIEVFKRKWIYYYRYCEIGFTTRTLGDHIFTFTREGYQDFGCDIFM